MNVVMYIRPIKNGDIYLFFLKKISSDVYTYKQVIGNLGRVAILESVKILSQLSQSIQMVQMNGLNRRSNRRFSCKINFNQNETYLAKIIHYD
jgi:hypothetical protein